MTTAAIVIIGVMIASLPMVLLLCWEFRSKRAGRRKAKYKVYVRSTHYWGEGRRHCMFCYVTRNALEHRMKSDTEALDTLRRMRLERAR